MHDVRFIAWVSTKKPTVARFAVVFTALVWTPMAAWGQQRPLTEDEVVAQGLERAYFDDMRQGQQMVGEGEGLRVSAWDNPELAYQREQLSGDIADLDTVLVTQRFELSGRRGLRQEAASLQGESQLKHLEWERTLYILEVRERFHALLYRQLQASRMEGWHQHLKQIHSIIEARTQSGDASALDLRRIESALALVEARREDVHIERDQAWSQLEALVGELSAGEWPRVQGELLPEDEPDTSRGFGARADVQALELEQRALELEVDAAERSWVPGLELGLGYLRQSGGSGGSDADGFTLMLGLEVPLFSHGQGDALLARGQALVLRTRRERMAFRLEHRLSSASGELSRRVRLAQSYRDKLKRADETAQLAREAYEGNALPLGELLNVYEHLHDVQQQAAVLEWQARRAYIATERLQGGRP